MGQFIDICFHISVPLDVSLRRRMLRDYHKKDEAQEDILTELKFT